MASKAGFLDQTLRFFENPQKKLRMMWEKAKADIDIADSAFIFLRIIIICGGIGWLFFSEISAETFTYISFIYVYFAAYTAAIYVSLFILPYKKRYIHVIAIFFDLAFATLLIRGTGGFNSSFFNAFYLITALYSFYFGVLPGTLIASAAALCYFASGDYAFNTLHWTDFSVRVAFLFLLAVPLGVISQKLSDDKRKIEGLNQDLRGFIEELRNVQGKLIQVEKLSALGRLTADVAHEIRNPLTSIGGFARRLNKKLASGSREKEYAEVVVAEVNRLERILRDVLTFSREARNDMEYQEINGTIRESVQAFTATCKDHGIHVETTLETSLPQILIDRDQVRQAANNLISNAIDVMPEGGQLIVKTYMEKKSEVDYVTVAVSDTGPGMPEESVNMIFEPFYTTKEIGVGTGLGLSICKKIIDEHNGLISVDSRPGAGTTFRILFPYQSDQNGRKIKCWEFHKCGVEKTEGAANFRCPAYPDYGRICWAIAGTFCGKRVSGAIAQKLGDCRKCPFYKRVGVQKEL